MLKNSRRFLRVVQTNTDSWLIRISLAMTFVLLFFIVWSRIINILSTNGFEPHGICLLWIPGLITLFVGSDTIIGLSYVCISFTLVIFVSFTHKTIPFQWVFIAFGAFIVLCGATHFIDVLVLWYPAYWLSGVVKLLTAIASIATASAFLLSLPQMLIFVQHAANSEERKKQLQQAHHVLQEEVQNKNQSLVTLAQEVTRSNREKQQTLALLQQVNEDLRRANEIQRNFVSVVSHEFRNALTSIQGFSGLIRDGDLSAEEIKTFATNIYMVSGQLERMITNLLDLEKMKSGQMPMSYEHNDLNEIIERVVTCISSTIPTHHFHFQSDDSLPSYLCDSDKMTQVITNLLNNAVKYSQEGEIQIGIKGEEENIHVWIQDHGIGIPPEALEYIFTPYSRVNGSTRYIKGSGLGLALCRTIIQMHRGRIWAESVVGEGSCFHFTLPL